MKRAALLLLFLPLLGAAQALPGLALPPPPGAAGGGAVPQPAAVPDPSCLNEDPQASVAGRCPTPPYAFGFDCPDAPWDAAARPCPARLAIAGEHLGAPSLAVAPGDPATVVVVSLAGSPAQGPTNASRTGPLALFSSRDHGRTFSSFPIPAPAPEALAVGARVAATAGGRFAVAGLFASPAADGFRHSLHVWSFDRAPESNAPAPTPVPVAEWTSQSASTLHLFSAGPEARLLLAWHEAVAGATPVARVATAPPALDAPWEPAAAIPCDRLADALASGGRLHFACAAPGGLRFHELDLASGSVRSAGSVPLGGDARLAPAGSARLAVLALEIDPSGVPRYALAIRTNATRWGEPVDVTEGMRDGGAPPVSEAKLLAFAYVPTSRTLHALVRETPVPDGGAASNPLVPRHHKHLAVLTRAGVVVLRESLGVDGPAARLARDAGPGASDPVPPDGDDALLAHGTRELVAYADAGTLLVGELVEGGALPSRAYEQGWGAAPAPPVTTEPAPPPRFTARFEIAAAALATGLVARVLLGRLRLRPTPHDQERSP